MRALPGADLEAADIAAQALVLVALVLLAQRHRALEGGEIALLHADAGAVEGQDMIHAAVEKRAVVADEQKAVLRGQIIADLLAPQKVQVIGRFVDEQVVLVAAEQRRQLELRLLAPAERVKRAAQRVLRHRQEPQLAPQPPLGRAARERERHAQRGQRLVGNGEGEIGEAGGRVHRAVVGQLAHQQAQQRGLPAPVAPHKPQPPARVHLKRQVGKNVVPAALVGKGEMLYG